VLHHVFFKQRLLRTAKIRTGNQLQVKLLSLECTFRPNLLSVDFSLTSAGLQLSTLKVGLLLSSSLRRPWQKFLNLRPCPPRFQPQCLHPSQVLHAWQALPSNPSNAIKRSSSCCNGLQNLLPPKLKRCCPSQFIDSVCTCRKRRNSSAQLA